MNENPNITPNANQTRNLQAGPVPQGGVVPSAPQSAPVSQAAPAPQGAPVPQTGNPEPHVGSPQAPQPAKKTLPVIQTGKARGFEDGIKQEDLIMPRVKLVHPISPEAKKIAVGSILDSLTKHALPERFIPIFFYKEYIRFNPRDREDKNFNPDFGASDVIWRERDEFDEKVIRECKFGPNGEKPLALTFLNFLCHFDGIDMPLVLSFFKSSYRAGKELLSMARFAPGDLFSRAYRLTSEVCDNSKGRYAVFHVSPSPEPVTEEEYKLCEGLWADFSSKPIEVDVEEHE